jgi:hypothetical protein
MHRTCPRSSVLLLLLLSLLVSACGGSGGGGGGGAGSTGSVGVLLTDGPVDDFSRILVTVSRIELLGPERLDLFVGNETFDLLQLENASNPFAIAENVPVGPWEKVRLYLDDLVLEKETDDGMGGVTVEQIHPPLPANGKIDLNPQGDFYVAPGELLLLEIDIDANKSIHVVKTGNGGYRFRPVVFIRVIDDPQDVEKLSRVYGVIDSFDGPDAFILCSDDLHAMDTSNGTPGVGCLRVNLFSDTGVFDANGDPGMLADLMVGDPVTVPGILRVLSHDVELDAIAIEMGPFGTFPRIAGVAATPVDLSDRFDLDVGSGQVLPPQTIPVQLQTGTALVTRRGFAVDADQIDMDVPVEVDGVPKPDLVTPTEIAAALVVVSPPAFDEMRFMGTIDMLDVPGRMLDLIGTADSYCVDVPTDATILTVSDGGAIASSTAANLSDLSDGLVAEVFGTMGASCIEADALVAYLP